MDRQLSRLYNIVGTRWVHIGGRLKQIESGPRGVCWGVNRRNNIYYRAGVTRRRPIGRRWVRVGGKLTFVSAGCSGVYGVSANQQIWRYRGSFTVYFFMLHEIVVKHVNNLPYYMAGEIL